VKNVGTVGALRLQPAREKMAVGVQNAEILNAKRKGVKKESQTKVRS
jgi:hypothetical protein